MGPMGPLFFLPALLALAVAAALADPRTLLVDDFEDGLRSGWKERSFEGHTLYEVVSDGGNRVLRAESRGTASGLFYELSFDPREYPILTWRWKVENLVEASDPTRKSGDDYPARLYVVFPHWFFPRTRSLNYIWATDFPVDRPIPNPFTANAMMIAVRSGPGDVGRWVEERRDLVADFRAAFGTDPPRAGAVAVMTDTDQTGERAVAYYDDIRLEGREGPDPRRE
ncbi:MAG: DUF3047 domain-containing protein [Deferrisomatales bacterium]